MPKILTPDEITVAARAGANARDLFFDAAGARVAKAVGLAAGIEIGDMLPDADSRACEFVISTDALDRYNSTIAPDGWHLDAFARNPVVLWAHDDSIPAIGRAENTRVDGGKLRSRAIFADADTHPLADTIYRLVKAKFLGAASVGWIPLEYKFVDGGERGFGVDYLAQELLEWSVVNVPANPDCLVDARSMGIDCRPLLAWAERALDQGGLVALPRAELEALRKAAGAPTLLGARKRAPFSFVDRKEQARRPRSEVRRDENNNAVPMIVVVNAFELSYDQLTQLIENVRAAGLAFESGAVHLLTKELSMVPAARSGRVLSDKNEKKLRAAHDHCMAACDHLMSVIGANKPDDGDDGDDTEQPTGAAGEHEERARKVRMLKLRTAGATRVIS